MIRKKIAGLKLRLTPEGAKSPEQKGSSSVEFMFAFLLLLWMCLGFVDIVFQAYNGMIIDYGSYMGSRSYLVDGNGTKWKEAAEKIARGTLRHTNINAYTSGSEVVLEVTNKEMLKSGIIYKQKRVGTISIANSLGSPGDSFSGDNAP